MEECPCACACGNGSTKAQEHVCVTTALSEEIRAAGVPRLVADRTPFVLARDIVFSTKNYVYAMRVGNAFREHDWVGPIVLGLSPANLGKALVEKIPFDAYRVASVAVTVKDVVFSTKGAAVEEIRRKTITNDLEYSIVNTEASRRDAMYTTTTPPDVSGTAMRVMFLGREELLCQEMTVINNTTVDEVFTGTGLLARQFESITRDTFNGGVGCNLKTSDSNDDWTESYTVVGLDSCQPTHEIAVPAQGHPRLTISSPAPITLRRDQTIGNVSLYRESETTPIPTKAETLRNFTTDSEAFLPCYGLVRVDFPPGLAQLGVITQTVTMTNAAGATDSYVMLHRTEYAAMNCSLTMRVEYAFANALEN